MKGMNKPVNHGKAYTYANMMRIKEMMDKDISHNRIAQIMGRTANALYQQMPIINWIRMFTSTEGCSPEETLRMFRKKIEEKESKPELELSTAE